MLANIKHMVFQRIYKLTSSWWPEFLAYRKTSHIKDSIGDPPLIKQPCNVFFDCRIRESQKHSDS